MITADELKQKLMDKTAEMVESVTSCDALYKLAQVYSEITKDSWTDKIFECMNMNKDISVNLDDPKYFPLIHKDDGTEN